MEEEIKKLNLTKEELEKMKTKQISLQSDNFYSNILFMDSKLTNYEMINVLQSKQQVDYYVDLMKCHKPESSQRNECILAMDCKINLLKYSRCLIKYPDDMSHLCLVSKNSIKK